MRIIAGEMRSRRLKAPEGMDTRPTADRVKEALFSILNGRVYGAKVLDLYAGSGALALEALSRGAESAVLADCGRAACAVIQENIDALGCQNRATLLRMKDTAAIGALQKQNARFDLIFLDPPYGEKFLENALKRISEIDILKSGGIIICERPAEKALSDEYAAFRRARDYRYGRTGITIYRAEAS